jgi:hypothetical protein
LLVADFFEEDLSEEEEDEDLDLLLVSDTCKNKVMHTETIFKN